MLRNRAAFRTGAVGAGSPLEVTLRLLSVDQLFTAPSAEQLYEADCLDSGMEELFSQLSHRSLKNGVRTTIYLPPSQIGPDTDERVRAAISRYCRLRIRRSENELRSVKQEGMRTLLWGAPVAAVALAISAAVFGDAERDPAQVFFGEGLLLVIAWVALWYPVEAFLVTVRPYFRERKLLEAVADMEVVVLPAGGPAAPTEPS